MNDNCERQSLIHVILQPEEKEFDLPRVQAKNVGRLLEALHLHQASAIVVREGTLLTHDVQLFPGQSVLVRKVMSSG